MKKAKVETFLVVSIESLFDVFIQRFRAARKDAHGMSAKWKINANKLVNFNGIIFATDCKATTNSWKENSNSVCLDWHVPLWSRRACQRALLGFRETPRRQLKCFCFASCLSHKSSFAIGLADYRSKTTRMPLKLNYANWSPAKRISRTIWFSSQSVLENKENCLMSRAIQRKWIRFNERVFVVFLELAEHFDIEIAMRMITTHKMKLKIAMYGVTPIPAPISTTLSLARIDSIGLGNGPSRIKASFRGAGNLRRRFLDRRLFDFSECSLRLKIFW